jgi:archaellum component FlaC
MGIFKNLFSCTCYNDNKEERVKTKMKDIEKEIEEIRNDINILFRVKSDTHSELRRMEDKINNNFSLLNNKIDNVIMILNSKL